MSPRDCVICDKHRNLAAMLGVPVIRERGLVLSHFAVSGGTLPTRGHLLLEPERHITEISEFTATEAEAFGGLLARGTRLIKERLGAEHVYLFRINDKVAHFHMHLIPRYPGTPSAFWGPPILNWADSPKVDLATLHRLSAELAAAAR